MKGKRRKPTFWFWGVLFIALVGGILWAYRSNFSPRSIKFAVAQTGTITHERKVVATFANQELPISAPFSGSVQFMGEDGQRVRRGEGLATFHSEGAAPGTKQENAQVQTLLATMGGLFFHQTDGLETIITTENLSSMDLDRLLAQTANIKIPGTSVQAGEFVGKIVNNLIPSQAFLELTSIEGLTVGKMMRLTVGEQTVSAKVLRKSEKPMGVVVLFPYYIDGSATKRRQEITWIYQSPTSGVLVPRSALWAQGEELGVFLWNEGVVHFKKVKVLDQDDNLACIENLTSGIPIVITPRNGLEGLVADVKNI
ncbi:MAG TPA: HlyD family efflux transporter periplasmic adaptor subunit [Desulfosporosinus sp.]|nr:HlyD family efflux transporter periplasmic adaptor subunit [Desulfosporosinus sp.]